MNESLSTLLEVEGKTRRFVRFKFVVTDDALMRAKCGVLL